MNSGNQKLTRRELGAGVASVTGVLGLGAGVANGAAAMPMRKLGKTGLDVSLFGLGSAQIGRDPATQQDANGIVDAAIEAGVNYIDTAPIYGLSERRLGVALKGKRDKFVLVTKCEATSGRDARWYVRESLMKLQTDYLDVVHVHNVGLTDRFPDIDALLAKDGALAALLDLKKQGAIGHVGLTTHVRPTRAYKILETGAIEVVMCAVNFVDVHTYNFEGTVFEEARKRGLGIVAMKILGGPTGKDARLSAPEHYEDAVRYALGIPGLSVAIMGAKNVAEFQQAVRTVKAYRPFTGAELATLTAKGKRMAAEWGELRGPVQWA